jgi:hypothetical protein
LFFLLGGIDYRKGKRREWREKLGWIEDGGTV